MMDVPQQSVMAHVDLRLQTLLQTGPSIHALVEAEMRCQDDITNGLGLMLTCDRDCDMAPPSRPPSPLLAQPTNAQLPCFGLGLRRQASFAPPSVLTETEVATQGELRKRCANAISKLARRSYRSLTHALTAEQAA